MGDGRAQSFSVSSSSSVDKASCFVRFGELFVARCFPDFRFTQGLITSGFTQLSPQMPTAEINLEKEWKQTFFIAIFAKLFSVVRQGILKLLPPEFWALFFSCKTFHFKIKVPKLIRYTFLLNSWCFPVLELVIGISARTNTLSIKAYTSLRVKNWFWGSPWRKSCHKQYNITLQIEALA